MAYSTNSKGRDYMCWNFWLWVDDDAVPISGRQWPFVWRCRVCFESFVLGDGPPKSSDGCCSGLIESGFSSEPCLSLLMASTKKEYQAIYCVRRVRWLSKV
ncbi:uncharacterized protein LOC122058831 [Macadamia integrifolia]|uniref:uncharacterized protein LOC122058831 n=1 Tax=Macadamia integrifolia TaxID=60698 RepID=UPI001C529A72|nr:uncharacterized protein LOC122058831 [Macadamia integrifolia]